jgi:hypothetical protein
LKLLSPVQSVSQSSMVLWLSYLIASQKPGVRTFSGSKQKLTNSKVVSEDFPKYLSVSNTDKQIGFPSFLADDPKEPCVVANLGKVSQPEGDFLAQSLYSIEIYIEINFLGHNDPQ